MITSLEQIQFQYEISMAIGRSLDLKNMLRRSLSTIMRKLNCQAGVVLQVKTLESGKFCFEEVFSIPRNVERIKGYQQFLERHPKSFNHEQYNHFVLSLPSHNHLQPELHRYIFDLPRFGVLILLKNDKPLKQVLVKSFNPLMSKLAIACEACLQNRELLQHRDNLQQLVTQKTSEIVERNVLLVKEITEKDKAEKRLRESEERYRAVVKQAQDGIYLFDPKTKKILHANSAFQNMLGFSNDEMKEITLYDFIDHDPKEIDDNIESIPQQTEIHIGDRKYRHRNGTLLDAEVSAKLIQYSGKEAILAIVRDITERKREQKEKEHLKEKLRQAQKFEALGTLAGGVAHDLNNILSGIVGYPELLLNKLSSDSELVEPLKAIQDSGNRASAVVADLLTVARSAASMHESYNINNLIEEYYSSPEFMKMASNQPEIAHKLILEAEEPFVLCSPVHIKKVLMNLVTNAVEAIGDSGEIEIRTYNKIIDASGENTLGLEKGLYLVVEVLDSGMGISEKDYQRIFDPFYTKKEMGRSGTGLGLTIVWNTVVNHDGKITVESSDNGTCFRLFFPCSANKTMVETVKEYSLESLMTKNRERILIVDDEPLLQDIASHMLEDLGYSVEIVSSGEQAVEQVSHFPFDLLVIDMLMGEGLNGKETFEAILDIAPNIKAIITSGYSESEDVKRALELGANAFLLKPYTTEQLGKAVKDALN